MKQFINFAETMVIWFTLTEFIDANTAVETAIVGSKLIVYICVLGLISRFYNLHVAKNSQLDPSVKE